MGPGGNLADPAEDPPGVPVVVGGGADMAAD